MTLKWEEKLSVKNSELDFQHKEIFIRVNNFLEAMRQQRGREEIGGMLGYIERYAKTHFEAEERNMFLHKYPGYLIHKSKHSEFQRDFADIKKRFQERGPSLDVIIASQSRLVDWLTTHIPREDRDFALFLNNAQ